MKNKIDQEFHPIVTEHDYRVVAMMEKHGGSFVKALAEAFYRADYKNFNILKCAFPAYWEEYKEWAVKKWKRKKEQF